MSARQRQEASQRALRTGADAYQAGRAEDTCPYRDSAWHMREMWRRGWNDARRAAEEDAKRVQYQARKTKQMARFEAAIQRQAALLSVSRCSCCHTPGTVSSGEWRWHGSGWEHACRGNGQAGHFPAEPRDTRGATRAALIRPGLGVPAYVDDGLRYDGDGRLVPVGEGEQRDRRWGDRGDRPAAEPPDDATGGGAVIARFADVPTPDGGQIRAATVWRPGGDGKRHLALVTPGGNRVGAHAAPPAPAPVPTLDALAAAALDPTLLAGLWASALVAYQDREGLDNDVLCARLGCDMDSLALLAILQLPAGGADGLNLVYLYVAAAYTGIAVQQLEPVLRAALTPPAPDAPVS